MGNKEDAVKSLSQLRRNLWIRGLVIIGLLIALLVFFSLPVIQAHWLPEWILPYWRRIVAIAVVVIISLCVGLPIVIEANINTRVLNGPGEGELPVDFSSHIGH